MSRGFEFLILSICGLALCPDLRIGPVQFVEIAFLLLLLSSPSYCLGRSFSLEINNFRSLTAFYICASVSIALFKLGQEFFPPLEMSILKQPGVVSVARGWQLVVDLGIALAIAKYCLQGEHQWTRAALVVARAGGVSVVVSALSYLALQAGYELPFGISHADRTPRWSGFFNEGGPFGLCLIGLLFVEAALATKRRRVTAPALINMTLLLLGVALSQSKAALAASALCVIIAVLLSARRVFASALLGVCALVLAVWYIVGTNEEMRAGAEVYYSWWAEETHQDVSESRDFNLVAGRIAAMTIVPNMIRKHPWTGVGLGNYPLVRNNPMYRGRFPDIEIWDLPGLGLLAVVAEVGIPLTLLMASILAVPACVAWKSRASFSLTLVSLFPLVAVLVSVQYYFAYVWLFAGLSLGASIAGNRSSS